MDDPFVNKYDRGWNKAAAGEGLYSSHPDEQRGYYDSLRLHTQLREQQAALEAAFRKQTEEWLSQRDSPSSTSDSSSDSHISYSYPSSSYQSSFSLIDGLINLVGAIFGLIFTALILAAGVSFPFLLSFLYRWWLAY